MHKQEIIAQVVEAIEKVALEEPEQLPFYIADVIAVLAMKGFSAIEIDDVNVQIDSIIDRYLGGHFIEPTVIRSNSRLN